MFNEGKIRFWHELGLQEASYRGSRYSVKEIEASGGCSRTRGIARALIFLAWNRSRNFCRAQDIFIWCFWDNYRIPCQVKTDSRFITIFVTFSTWQHCNINRNFFLKEQGKYIAHIKYITT